jgi:hypothetical protein
MNTPEQYPNQEITSDARPPIEPGKAYWVQCKSYRCLAVLDQQGRWRSYANDKELTDVIKVFASNLTQPLAGGLGG